MFAKNPTLENLYNIKVILSDENNASRQIGFLDWEVQYFADLLRNAWILAIILCPLLYIMLRPGGMATSEGWIVAMVSMFFFPVFIAFPFVFVFCNIVAFINLSLGSINQRQRWQIALGVAAILELVVLVAMVLYFRH